MGNCHLASECESDVETLTDEEIAQCMATNQRLRNKIHALQRELRKFYENTRIREEKLWPNIIDAKSANREEDVKHCEVSPISRSCSSCYSSRMAIEDDINFDWAEPNFIRVAEDDREVVGHREEKFHRRLSVPVLSKEKIVWV
mmetsp:Transcript_11852/g.16418  ORF Transcript_11852/g.16418 Transcript_11852/m.16418 type:complete len:144 (+) Transcript_11852:168-599(+)